MGAFEFLFKKHQQKKEVKQYFQMLDGYTPIFTSYDGGVYEMELTRSCIHTFANHCSKLMPSVHGADLKNIQKLLENKPNEFMTSAQFLYKTATIYEAKNTCVIVPVLNSYDDIVGFYPLNYRNLEIVQDESNTPWLRYTFGDNSVGSMELSRCGIINKFLYSRDVIGDTNDALKHTLQLIDLQNQGIQEGIKNGASFRFMATVNNFVKSEALQKERQKFVEDNFGPEAGGLLLFPNTYSNIQQIKSNPEVVDNEQMQTIQTRVYNYFGANEDILQNKAVGDKWSAYYESKIEPFAIQLSQAMTNMTFTDREKSTNNEIIWSSNRLQYMTNTDKLSVSSQMFDRGIFSLNQVMDIWNLPHVKGGDERFIRKEYTNIKNINEGETKNE